MAPAINKCVTADARQAVRKGYADQAAAVIESIVANARYAIWNNNISQLSIPEEKMMGIKIGVA